MNNNSNRNERRMDGETAIAFAAHAFAQLHPRDTCPEWLGRCSTVCYTSDKNGRFVISFTLTPKATNDAIAYFEVIIDQNTAEATVIKDLSFFDFIAEGLQGY